MSELEHRQEVLIKKLDTLYDRIKTISSYCNGTDEEGKIKTTSVSFRYCVQNKFSLCLYTHTAIVRIFDSTKMLLFPSQQTK